MQRRPDPRHLFDRDPLLIPKRVVERPRWYKRPGLILAIIGIICTMSTMGYLVSRYGVRAR